MVERTLPLTCLIYLHFLHFYAAKNTSHNIATNYDYSYFFALLLCAASLASSRCSALPSPSRRQTEVLV